MNWFKQHFGIRLDHNTLGNLMKNVSPAVAFTPAGMLGAGGLAALGEALRGHANLGDMARAGITNAGIGGAARGAMGMLHSAFVPSSSAATGAVPSAPAGIASEYGADPDVIGLKPPLSPLDRLPNVAMPGVRSIGSNLGSIAGPSSVPDVGGSMLTSTGNALRGLDSGPSFLSRAGSFAHDNANAIGMGMQAVGNLAGSGSENALRRAQADQIRADTQATQDELARRKRLDDALAPVRQSLMGQFGDWQTHPYPIAPNPYAPRG